jgi:SAM-dependent methyltransferase
VIEKTSTTMQGSVQKRAFEVYEADAWFERNLEYIKGFDASKDRIIGVLEEYGVTGGRVLEVGCSAGHRLNGLRDRLPACKVFGIEPSVKAVEYGREHYKDIDIRNGTGDDLKSFESGSMDVVIVGFVFYVVDREMLFRVMAEVDRVLKNGGLLVISDFFTEVPRKNEYSHIKDVPAYSFKQSYEEIFTSSRMYLLLDKCTLNHLTKQPDASNDYYNKYTITLLKRDVLASYK